MSEKKKLCDREGVCCELKKHLSGDNSKGFRYQERRRFEPPEIFFAGVSYHIKPRGKGLLISFCPFCGGKPGEIANRDEKAKEEIENESN